MNPQLRQAEADAIGVPLSELLEIEQNREDEIRAKLEGIEVWELHLRRSGFTDQEIEARRIERRQEIQRILRI